MPAANTTLIRSQSTQQERKREREQVNSLLAGATNNAGAKSHWESPTDGTGIGFECRMMENKSIVDSPLNNKSLFDFISFPQLTNGCSLNFSEKYLFEYCFRLEFIPYS